MENAQKEVPIRACFDMWIRRDSSAVASIFAADIYYSEGYGPEDSKLQEIYQWIDAMRQKQRISGKPGFVSEWFYSVESQCWKSVISVD